MGDEFMEVDNAQQQGITVLESAGTRSREQIFSTEILESYDRERHITVPDALQLLQEQARHVDPAKLTSAMQNEQIHVYEFKGRQYVDRLDMGRVFYTPKEFKGITVERVFTDGRTDPYTSAGPLTRRHLKITKETGEIIFEMNDAEFPEHLDDVSAQIVAQKYFLKPHQENLKEALRSHLNNDHESSLVHLVKRVTNFVTEMGDNMGYFATPQDKETFREEMIFLQMTGMFAFNSPVQFNAGIYQEYGIKGSPGLKYRRDPKTGNATRTSSDFEYPQCHACFIKGPRDNLESILHHVVDEGSIFSSGSGIGHNIGSLREESAILSTGGRASGPMSFFKVYDAGGGVIKSGGKSRRAARMATMRYTHPDSMKFIRGKVREDKKALELMRAGFSPGMDGEAYASVAYQNTNISVRFDDHFFAMLEQEKNIELTSVIDDKVVATLPASEMMRALSFGSWRIGDPAVQYETAIQEMHTCKNSGRINSSNPCSEYMFLDDTSCNLGSFDLKKFADKTGKFMTEKFRKAVHLATTALDILNGGAAYPVKDIARISPEFGTIGLGYAGLGSLLMRRGIAYGSEEGRALAGAITAIMTGASYEQSAHLAETLEPFMHFELNKKPMLDVIRKHQKNLEDIPWEHVPQDMKKEAERSWSSAVNMGERFGFRNAQTTLLAPTGTISYLMGCYDSTGVEPAISLRIFKNLAGGGTLTLVNTEAENALKNLGYTGVQVHDIGEFIKEKNTVRGSPHLHPKHYTIFDTALGNKEEQGAIPFQEHIHMLGAVQPFLSGAVSKTSNLPESASVKDIYDGYILGHQLGLKALAVFRNNAKPVSALDFGGKSYTRLQRGEKEELPARRECFESEVKIGDTPFHVMVSEYADGKPGQIVFLSYKAGSTLQALLTTQGIGASKALQRGVDLEDVVSGWIGQQFEPSGLVQGDTEIKTALSFLDYAGKFLLINYKGSIEFAQEPEKVQISKLRGAKNGSFRTYARMKIDDWDEEQVLQDSELGGFIHEDMKGTLLQKINGHKTNGNGNARGVACQGCGNIMAQTSPNCYQCNTCGDKRGGCGA